MKKLMKDLMMRKKMIFVKSLIEMQLKKMKMDKMRI